MYIYYNDSSFSFPFTVHAPTVTVALDNLGSPLLAGTSRSLMCSFDPMGLIVAVSWTKDGTPLSTGGRVTISTVEQSNSTLTLNPLRTSDGAKYECVLTVTIMNGRPPMYTFPAMIDLNVTSEFIIPQVQEMHVVYHNRYIVHDIG